MRPITLELEGFSGFRDPTSVNFEDAELFAFVGPTGSGKSSIIDGITFALFGSVPRYSDERLVQPVIHQLSPEAKVRLHFELGDRRYVAVRVVRRTKTGATTKEARLEEVDGELLAGAAPEMRNVVEELLGLTFEQFTKTVVLPQGEFAAFLHDKPANRQALLRKLLDLEVYTRMARAAGERSRRAGIQAETLREQLAAMADLSEEGLHDLEKRCALLMTAKADAESLTKRLSELQAAQTEQTRQLATLDERWTALSKIVPPKDLAALDEDLSAADSQLHAAIGAAEAASDLQLAAEEAADAGPDVDECRRMLDARENLARLEAELPSLSDAVSAAEDAARSAAESHTAATAELDGARERLAAAERLAGASALVAHLEAGRPCPVCEQIVKKVPQHDLDEDLARAKKAAAAAKRAHATTDQSVQETRHELATATARRDQTMHSLEELRGRLAEAPSAEDLRAQIQDAERLRTELKAASAAARKASAARTAAEQHRESLRKRERSAQKSLNAARDSVAVSEPPALDGTSILADWVALSDWATQAASDVDATRVTTRATLAALADDVRKLQDEADLLCAPLGIDPALDRLGEALAAAAARAESDIETYRERLAQRTETETKIESLAETSAVAGQLSSLLSAKGFERWLLEEALIELGQRASEKLSELSAGQYSLEAAADSFVVKDHRNADERRDVRTLSGGETFLASLSLALALADGIKDLAAQSTHLDSVFLDEGFGTLDPETLDVVASALEELGSSGRMVGIVTHIRELADRMPTRFEVHKDARSSRVERVEV